MTNSKRALRSGFCVRAACRRRISSQRGTWRTASSSASAISSGSASVSPGTASSRRHTRSSQASPSRREHGVAIGVEPGGLLALRPAASDTGAEDALERRPAGSPLVGRQIPPEHPRRVGEHALRVLLVALCRQGAHRGRRARRRHSTRRSTRLSHIVTHAAPRVSASGMSSTCASR